MATAGEALRVKQKLDFFKVKIINPFASHRIGWANLDEASVPKHVRHSGRHCTGQVLGIVELEKRNENLTKTGNQNLLVRMLGY